MSVESELHLIVLWERARAEEARILSDIARHVEIVAKVELRWPGAPVECFGRFYGAKLAEADGKVKVCGGGPFLLVAVRDLRPRYGLRETSRGCEYVNLRMFAMKTRYRAWTGGGHRVHTTNSPAETRRDIFLLTGRRMEEWARGVPDGQLEVLPGQDGWPSLRELFRCLNETTPYVVLRNSELLPEAFDPTLHGDIDLLVQDAVECSGVLGAHKVFPEAYRVHYEVMVAGQPVRFDFRFIGDGYYDERWERAIVAGGEVVDDVRRPAAVDAFHSLVYHALFQKTAVAPDYAEKALKCARAAGVTGSCFEEWLPALGDFMAGHGYRVTVPQDKSVYLDPLLPNWRDIVAEMCVWFQMEDIRPANLASRRVDPWLPIMFFSAKSAGRTCFIKYSPVAPRAIAAEWEFARRFRRLRPDLCVEPFFWHQTATGGAFVVQERMAGRTLERLLLDGTRFTAAEVDRMVCDMKDISDTLLAAGIVHRDIRPANLMVSPDSHVKLFDFQFAVDRGSPNEYIYFAEHHKELLYPLGAEYARGPGLWNDRLAMVRCLERLPDCPARAKACEELSVNLAAHDRTACLPGWMYRKLMKEYRRLLRRHWRHVLLRRKDKPYDVRRREYLEYILHNWKHSGA